MVFLCYIATCQKCDFISINIYTHQINLLTTRLKIQSIIQQKKKEYKRKRQQTTQNYTSYIFEEFVLKKKSN